jgi:hypothetical protein
MPEFQKFNPGQRVKVDGNEVFVHLQNTETGLVTVKTPGGSQFIYHPSVVQPVTEKPAPKSDKAEPA